MVDIIEALKPAEITAAKELFTEYAASLGVDLCFQGFDEELATLPGKYAPPAGGLFLAIADGIPAGCVGLRPLDPPDTGELKRLYIRPELRGRGGGRLLTLRAIARAAEAGYRRIRLDTLPSMTDAQNLYRRLGFRDIPAYRFNPVAGVRYMELELHKTQGE